MGDQNAKTGIDKVKKVTGGFEWDSKNECGEKLIEFCLQNKLKIANTFFEKKQTKIKIDMEIIKWRNNE